MPEFTLTVDSQKHTVDVEADMPLLWVLRDHLGKTETKFGCGMAECGTCMVLVDGKLTRTCATPIAQVNGKNVTTIEGLLADSNHPLQKAWADGAIPECDYCQPGQTLAAAALLAQNPHPSKKEVKKALAGILCRCDGRKQIRDLLMRMK
jgi:aerobic-type carbon monoxide dehydrogenase small subunit (CoxS/CutS family)